MGNDDVVLMTSKSLLFAPNITARQYIVFSIAINFKNHTSPRIQNSGKLIQLLQIISGSVELNPGPNYSCGECGKSVYIGRSIACDECNRWYHKKYFAMNSITFNDYHNSNNDMEWNCLYCGLANISLDVFESLLGSFRGSGSNMVAEKKFY